MEYWNDGETLGTRSDGVLGLKGSLYFFADRH
jgi:hypothetical protein